MKLIKVPTFLMSILWLALFAVLPFCLNTESETKLLLGQINEPGRIAFASRTLGHRGFHRIANLRPEDGALERFIYSKVLHSLRHAPGADIQDITNTIIAESNDAGVDPLFVLSVIQHESSFSNQTIGSHGEIGLMQVMPATAQWLAAQYGIIYHDRNDLFDPITNIQMGVSYISWLHHKFPKTKDLASAYNMGPKHLRKALNDKRRPLEYYSKVMKNYVAIYAEAQYHILSTAQIGGASTVAQNKQSSLLDVVRTDSN
jgi:soluble lytic murein transglycosylase